MRTMPWLLVLMTLALAACSSAAPPDPREDVAPLTAAPAVPTSEVPPPGQPAAQAGTPTPAVPVAEAATAAPGGEVDYSCSTDAECTVKDVGNCCGYYPACVNVDSPTFPDQVQAQCQKEGRSSICGFREISACACNAGRCEAADAGLPGAAVE